MGESRGNSRNVDDLRRQAYESFKEYRRWIDTYERLLKMDRGLPEFPSPATVESQQVENALKNAEMVLERYLDEVDEYMKKFL